MATQVSDVSSSAGPNCSSHQERSDGVEVVHPLIPVQNSTVSSTTGDHDLDVLAALIQLIDQAVYDMSAERVRIPEVQAAAVQLLDEQFVSADKLWY